ncbi:hypothetical protein [Adhaeretor mobilis]|uniref:Uncharacterized protein n=1 Tax=Adhaeretor mobilis TaxID=1930276 RepID=A0A517MYW2_9BACT|nr:hypothetical protein [Adhaeretor mobilis]QDT00034.1 hypothetical protein HG15A2_33690 [Adhaeretor mobilis]
MVCILLRGSAASICWVCFTANAQVDLKSPGFAEVLRDADIGEPKYRLFETWDGTWSHSRTELATQILYWFERFDASQHKNWEIPQPGESIKDWIAHRGELVEITGLVVSARQLTSDQPWYSLVVQSDAFPFPAAILTRKIPGAWSRSEDSSLAQPISCRGVILGNQDVGDKPALVLLADHVAWHPQGNVPAGWLELAKLGYDVSLLDEVRHAQPFVTKQVSEEAVAFRAALKAVAASDHKSLSSLAKQVLKERQTEWRKLAKLKQVELKEQATNRGTPEESKLLKREYGVALAALERGEQGLSSVAPLFLTPQEETGRLVLLEGTARRAVKIVLTEGDGQTGDYYEVDLFTTDSQNLPITCCVARLPNGFPEGDSIRAPVRVAGFFFKKWRYRSRKPEEPSPREHSPRGSPQGQRADFSPIVIGPTVQWVQPQTPASNKSWGVFAGVGFLVLMALLWVWLTKISRRDRIARNRQSRYDVGL